MRALGRGVLVPPPSCSRLSLPPPSEEGCGFWLVHGYGWDGWLSCWVGYDGCEWDKKRFVGSPCASNSNPQCLLGGVLRCPVIPNFWDRETTGACLGGGAYQQSMSPIPPQRRRFPTTPTFRPLVSLIASLFQSPIPIPAPHRCVYMSTK